MRRARSRLHLPTGRAHAASGHHRTLSTEGDTARLVTAASSALDAGDRATAERLLREALAADGCHSAAWRAMAECQTGARRAICLLWVLESEARLLASTPTANLRVALPRRVRRLRPATAVAAAALLSLAATGTAVALPDQDRILPSISISGISVGGLSRAEAGARLRAVALRQGEQILTVRAAGQVWAVRARYLLGDQIDASVGAAYRFGHEQSLSTRLRSRLDHLRGAAPTFDGVVPAPRAVARLIEQLHAKVDRPVRDAEVVRGAGGWVVAPEQTGIRLDEGAAAEALRHALLGMTTAEPTARMIVDLPMVETRPRLTTRALVPLAARLEALRRAPLRIVAGDRSWIVDRSAVMDLPHGALPEPGALAPSAARIEQLLDTWSAEIDRPARPSRLVWNRERVADLIPGVVGLRIDRPAAMRQLASVLAGRAPSLDLPLLTTQPPPGEIEHLGLLAEIGRGESQFVTYSSPDRDANVEAGGRDVDGVVVPPGGVFSFTRTVGSITWEKGYRWGDMIEAGQVKPSLGGGICQVSTTVFRAAFWSGLEIVERHAHSWRLPWYEVGSPPGMDATISLGGPDLKFRNNTGAHILLRVTTDLQHKRQVVVVYGTPGAKRVEMASGGAGSRFSVSRRIVAGDGVLADDTFTSSYAR